MSPSVDDVVFNGNGTSNGAHANGNGTHTNGHGTNGHSTNGHATNGHSTNGHSNGHANGHSNGHANGHTTNGHATNGHTNGSSNSSSHTNGANGTSVEAGVPIAVCGMALRLPGGLHTPQQFWDFLVAKGDARGKVPASRYKIESYYSPKPKPGTVKSEYGYFLDESVDLGALDTSFFTMPRNEVERADPQQRQMLEVAREAIEDAGEQDWKGRRYGVYMGSFGEDWLEMFAKEAQQYGLYRVSGYGDFMLSNRVSYEMNLQGPSMTVRTGCSAALVALHEACQDIARGVSEGAIVGGANLILAPGMTTAMTDQGVLAPDGSCKTFSADANGYGRGEAITAVFIKPLEAALRDGNPIRAVIRATATNNDGKTPGISVPSSERHEDMIRHAYQGAGIKDYSETAFVECHGTGTPTGDPIEAGAVARVFGPSGGVYIGSVKPNLGHSEGASGLVSLIKMVLALENRTIPPNIKFTSPNPAIPFESAKLIVPTEPTPWPESRKERVSVNSFGIGGSNAHVILESARSFSAPNPHKPSLPAVAAPNSDDAQLLVYSANSANSLQKLIENYQAYATAHPHRARDLAYTLSNRREHLPHRAFVLANSAYGPGTASPVVKAGLTPPNVIMVFTGQGAQWPQMGRELLRSAEYPVFKQSIKVLDKLLATTPFAPEWKIEDELLKPSKTSRLSTAELSQPLCTALQIALVDTLRSIGVEPAAVVGHSSGEIAAAYAVGALTAKEAITVAFHRGQVAKLQHKAGGMAAIGLGWDAVEKFLIPGSVGVACENSPKSVTLSGDADKLKEVVAAISEAEPDVLARLLKVDKAYHSHHMVEIGEDYHALIEKDVAARDAAEGKLFFSSVSGTLVEEGTSAVLGPRYWQKNLESPVLFSPAVGAILQHPVAQNAVLLEVGPHSALAGPLRQIQAKHANSAPYVTALNRGKNSVESLLTAVGKLYQLGVPVDFKTLVPTGSVLPDLPRYPWNHAESYWYESRLSKEWRLREFPHHDLLGVRLPESTEFEPVWRNLFHLDNAPWVRDHKIKSDIIFPFAGYAAMAGEAARQISGVPEGFTLRHVVVSTALVVSEGKPVEVMTSLRKHRLTDSLDSSWWEFSIASHNGHTWTKHCFGEVKPVAEELPKEEDVKSKEELLPRKVDKRKAYFSMARAGLNYGPEFQGLEDVRSSATDHLAGAKGTNDKADKANYHLHPVLIDISLQLMSAAATKGYTSLFRMMVPTNIEELTIYRTAADIDINVQATFIPGGGVIGGGSCVTTEGATVLRMSGIKLSQIDEGDDEAGKETTTHTTARYEWGQHIDFVDARELIKPSIDRALYTPALDELTRLCLVWSQRKLAGKTTKLAHMALFQKWVDDQLALLSADVRATVEALADDKIASRVESIVASLADTPAYDSAVGMLKVFKNVETIFSGEAEALEILLADETLTKLYNFTDASDRSAFIQRLAHSKPNLRVLEIGAGTGASSASILRDLNDPSGSGRVLFSKYTFTDISSGFFVAAKERFKGVPNMEYATLDISKSPAEQGFEGREYDLVLATNVIHATKSLKESLTHIRQLLAPNGRLLLHELWSPSKWINYIFGTLPGWWYGAPDGRADEPYVSPARWEKELLAAGFAGLDATVLDSPEPTQLNAIMVAKPAPKRQAAKRVTLLTEDLAGDFAVVRDALERRGYHLDVRSLRDETLPANQDVVALLDKDRPFFEGLDADRFEAFKTLVDKKLTTSQGIFWITRQSQFRSRDPRWAQVIGVARTVRSELSLDFATCEVDDLRGEIERVADAFAHFQRREEDESLKPEFEYAVADGGVHVGRYYPFALADDLLTAEADDRIVLHTNKPGRLNSLHWSRKPRAELVGDQVEVETYSAGLNFKDVLGAMGITALPEEGFGLEAAGVVRRLGPSVKNLREGDRVMLIARGSFATSITTSEQLCAKLPDTLSFDEASTMPCVYATAIYSLFTIGGLEKGQSILIHSACGGVGIAAIQLAQMVGAEIYATVGNDEKVQYLLDTFHLPRHRIFNSRNASFVEGVMRETGGRGVDLALNSLSGELLHATWRTIAVFGKMVEIGKRDLLGAGKLAMDVFLDNRSYCCVDLDQICYRRGDVAKKLLNQCVEYFSAGHIQPIRPTKVFSASAILEAFRYMQQGQHLGKIVVAVRDSASGAVQLDDAIARRRVPVVLDPSASYLLVGGLGGLGQAISTWMVEHGARRLVYLSRSAGADPQHADFVRELRSMGCAAELVKGSVTVAADVARAVEVAQGGADNKKYPLKGVLQMSMVLRDQALRSMTLDEWDTAVAPKVQGTWHLHEAAQAAGAVLDFFVLFSSMSGTIGQPGQANYAGANTFLDSFVQFRASQGLAVSTVDIGAVEDIGYIAHNEALLRKMKATAAYGISEQELLQAMAAAMTNLSTSALPDKSAPAYTARSNFVLGLCSTVPLSSPDNRAIWRKDARMAVYHNFSNASSAGGASSSNDALAAFLTRARGDAALLKTPEAASLLAVEIGRKLFSFLLKPEEDLQTSCSLSDLGMDSLVAIEMRSWWKQAFGFDISVLEMLGMGTLDALGQHAAEGLLVAMHGEEGASA